MVPSLNDCNNHPWPVRPKPGTRILAGFSTWLAGLGDLEPSHAAFPGTSAETWIGRKAARTNALLWNGSDTGDALPHTLCHKQKANPMYLIFSRRVNLLHSHLNYFYFSYLIYLFIWKRNEESLFSSTGTLSHSLVSSKSGIRNSA